MIIIGADVPCFLDEVDNEEFAKVFRSVRLQHVMNDRPSMSTIETDRIIPEGQTICLYCHDNLRFCTAQIGFLICIVSGG